jgi:hypothetical protein
MYEFQHFFFEYVWLFAMNSTFTWTETLKISLVKVKYSEIFLPSFSSVILEHEIHINKLY